MLRSKRHIVRVNTTVAAASGLGAAALFAAGTAMQYRAAMAAEDRVGLDVRAVATFARHSLTSRRWILGTALLATGFGFHALALHEGPLTLVQPILIVGVLFALPASRHVGGPPLRATDLRWAGLLVAALAVFLITATPSHQGTHGIDSGPAVATVGLGAIGIVTCVVLARRRPQEQTALLLGVAAGIALAGSAALIKASTDVLVRGVIPLLTSWDLYALIAVGAGALLLSQLAYRAGPMIASLPAVNTANPLMSVVIGTAVFDERFRTGVVATGIEVAALATVLVATAALSRRAAQASA